VVNLPGINQRIELGFPALFYFDGVKDDFLGKQIVGAAVFWY